MDANYHWTDYDPNYAVKDKYRITSAEKTRSSGKRNRRYLDWRNTFNPIIFATAYHHGSLWLVNYIGYSEAAPDCITSLARRKTILVQYKSYVYPCVSIQV